MSFDEFQKQFSNQPNVGNTPENRGQCVGLVEVWIDTLGGPHDWGNATDLYNNADPNFFAKIPNTPTAIPQQGDIIVWDGKFNGGLGHTGIATGKADINSFDCFEQNDPINSKPHVKNYNYAYITGWLRPKNPSIDTVSVFKQDFENLVTKSTNWDVVAAQFKLDSLDKQGGKIVSDQVENLQKDLETCRTSTPIQSPLDTPSGEATTPSTETSINSSQFTADISNSAASPSDSQPAGNSTSSSNSGDSLTPPGAQINLSKDPISTFLKKLFDILSLKKKRG